MFKGEQGVFQRSVDGAAGYGRVLSDPQDGCALLQSLGFGIGQVFLSVLVVDVVRLLSDEVQWVSSVEKPVCELCRCCGKDAGRGGPPERSDELTSEHSHIDGYVVGRGEVEVRMGIYGLAEGSDVQDAVSLEPVSLVDGEIQEVYFLFRDRGRVLDGGYSRIEVGDQLVAFQFGWTPGSSECRLCIAARSAVEFPPTTTALLPLAFP